MKQFFKSKNETGITIVELLAAMTISLLIIGLVSSVLVGSFNSYKKTHSHSNLRQEANLFLAELTEVHHKTQSFTLENDPVTQLIKVNNGSDTWLIGNPSYQYALDSTTTTMQVTRETDYLTITLTITDPNNEVAPYVIKTVINRR